MDTEQLVTTATKACQSTMEFAHMRQNDSDNQQQGQTLGLVDQTYYELSFDGLPESPNDRPGQWKKMKLVRDWRNRVATAALAAGIPNMDRMRITFVIYRRNLGVADADNDAARFKAVVDGLVDAGIVAGDSRKYVSYGECREERGKQGFKVILSPAIPCSKCGRWDNDVKPFMSLAFCFDCYALLVGGFMQQTEYNKVEDWLKGARHGEEGQESQEPQA